MASMSSEPLISARGSRLAPITVVVVGCNTTGIGPLVRSPYGNPAATDVGDVTLEAGTSVTIRELAERIAERTGSDSAITHVEPRAGDVDRSRADVSRAAEVLGYAPSVDLDDGLADYVEWYRTAGGVD